MYNANQEEQEILKHWDKTKAFEKSVESRPESKPYVFYDGPPFATGLPHYGHIVASTMKDVVPRFWTMKGFRVERRWGWDCHGLPIENIVEKELGTKSKKEIEAMGVAKFNELCRSKVLGYVGEWEKTIRRLGRWVDMEHAYRTMDLSYMESVWWVFKQLWDKELVYEDYRSMHICPRCETTLSQQEVSEGYKDVKDISVFVKFKVKPESVLKSKHWSGMGPEADKVYILAWTTTPWTLPGNVALAINPNVTYSMELFRNEYYLIAYERRESIFFDNFGKEAHEIDHVEHFSGSNLIGLEYEPLFPYYKDTKNAFRVVAGDFVTTTEGTGIVHIAPAFGEDDFQVGKREEIPLVQHVSMDGKFKPEVTDFAGQEVKPRSDDDKVRLSSDIAVIRYLQEHGSFFAKQNLVHSYPHCWRCDTPLLNYATSSWFVKVTEIKDKALNLAKKINWSPEHIKEGRFGKWLEGARDWSVSRQRFWASVMPVWMCETKNQKNNESKKQSCDNVVVFGSVSELEEASGKKVTDLHKHVVDEITFPCEKCDGTMKRIPDVLDTWFDSGSMPYAQAHYPFENKKKFEDSFPAEFIAEGQDQTRAWFYYLHVLATALFKKIAFKNVIVNGIVLAEDGKKMSKKLQNYPDPNLLLEKYGADALRYYLVSSPVMEAESLNFSEAGVREMFNKVVNTLYNVVEFYLLFASERGKGKGERGKSENVLDRWILAKLNLLVKEVTEGLENYRLAVASRPIVEFITELSQWYVRRSRDRFKSSSAEASEDKAHALATLHEVLLTLSKVMAPFTPFIAEKIYLILKGEKESVHLEEWPEVNDKKINDKVIKEMEIVRKAVELGLALRAEAGIKVRQVLGEFSVADNKFSEQSKQIIADELNVKEVTGSHDGPNWIIKQDEGISVALNTEITDELKKEGLAREIVRTINQIRKEQKLTINDRVAVKYRTGSELLQSVFRDFNDEIKKSTLADELVTDENVVGTEVEIDGKKVAVGVEKNG
ncbi:MAG: hypothetical protein A2754_03675 [Candidatus Magasanikbacteria bacterium RIFCSPHIGHO2_01_FULL_47_8]|uniref:Isoleucine--tRNA ligase n=1 Tax=Candidatus Magasanikbacteria bacterium RIFCSPHIGHO2_01_FULL_47_8 TaxID=1798673 RepID=A0A1F6MFL6_9BACT|nr:MAG: hypothetical protein A2754_03675 [Candidatus Magasanikbacteria bacterium RIFCSPHIGHO2_01_FULL_47_8]